MFEEASLQGSDWQGALLYYNANLKKADFSSADFTDASMYYGIDASNAIFDDANFDKANLYAMKFNGASFKERLLQGRVDRCGDVVRRDRVQECGLHGRHLRRREHLRLHRPEDGADDCLRRGDPTGTSWDEAYIHTGVQFDGAKFGRVDVHGRDGEACRAEGCVGIIVMNEN